MRSDQLQLQSQLPGGAAGIRERQSLRERERDDDEYLERDSSQSHSIIDIMLVNRPCGINTCVERYDDAYSARVILEQEAGAVNVRMDIGTEYSSSSLFL